MTSLSEPSDTRLSSLLISTLDFEFGALLQVLPVVARFVRFKIGGTLRSTFRCRSCRKSGRLSQRTCCCWPVAERFTWLDSTQTNCRGYFMSEISKADGNGKLTNKE